MIWLFWGAISLIAYSYLGYPLYLWTRCRYRNRPVRLGSFFPSISIVLVVHNEATVLERKLQNLLQLTYPAERMEIVVLSDGSTDETNSILLRAASAHDVKVIFKPQCQGKASGINDATKAARGAILVFMDARQNVEPDAVALMMENFADPAIGCVSGNLCLGEPTAGEQGEGLGLYWQIEKRIREMESGSGSVVGATGAFYAVRRDLLVQLPAETLLDDVYLPLHVVRQGQRVVFDHRAHVWDIADQGGPREFARKVRTLSGNYQLLRLAPWLLHASNPIRFEFVSHKLTRLFVPFALAAAVASAALLQGPIYRVALILQLGFYGLSALALVRLKPGLLARLADSAFAFVLLNTAAVVAFANIIGRRKVVWVR